MPVLAANIDLKAKAPLDSRLVKDTVEELADLLEYEGLEVWVRSEKKKYRYNGVDWEEVATGGGDNSRELTKEEYDALTDAEKTNGTTYYVTDEGGDNDILDDTEASTSKTYSSNKIEEMVSGVSQKIEGIIDDTTKSTDRTYSSNKIEEAVGGVNDRIDGLIDDDNESAGNTYSSQKIESVVGEVSQKVDGIIDDGSITTESTYSSQQIETIVGDVSDRLNELIKDKTTSATSTYSSNKIESLVGDYMKKEELANGTLEKIGMYDDFDITADGSGGKLQYSDAEVILKTDTIELHQVAGGESRLKLGDGYATLEGSPFWTHNAKMTLTADGENGDSSATVEANNINLNGTVNVNGAPLVAPVVITGATPANDNIRGLTVKEMWDKGIRSGTYLVECHEQTSMSQGFFIGFLDFFYNNGIYELNDCSFGNLVGSHDTLSSIHKDGVYYLTYQGNHDYQDGRPVTMTFVKLNSYTDN